MVRSFYEFLYSKKDAKSRREFDHELRPVVSTNEGLTFGIVQLLRSIVAICIESIFAVRIALVSVKNQFVLDYMLISNLDPQYCSRNVNGHDLEWSYS